MSFTQSAYGSTYTTVTDNFSVESSPVIFTSAYLQSPIPATMFYIFIFVYFILLSLQIESIQIHIHI